MPSVLHPIFFSLNPQPEIITPRAHGLDISKYDLFFLPETATAQLDFVVQRISYNIYRDEAFLKLVDGVLRVPIRGGYHYLSSGVDWRRQADLFLEYVKPYDYHFFNCDFEGAFNFLSVDFAYIAWQWIQYVQQKSGKEVLLYTSLDLYNRFIAPSSIKYGIDWNKIKLWQAQWFYIPNPNGTPTNPRGRTGGLSLWQYTDRGDGTLYGVSRKTACDLNVYSGTVNDMRLWLKLDEPNPPLPPRKHRVIIEGDFTITEIE